MLKSIVKDEAVWVEVFNCVVSGGCTICVADDSNNSFKFFCQEESFITGLAGRGKHSLPVRYEYTMA